MNITAKIRVHQALSLPCPQNNADALTDIFLCCRHRKTPGSPLRSDWKRKACTQKINLFHLVHLYHGALQLRDAPCLQLKRGVRLYVEHIRLKFRGLSLELQRLLSLC